MKSTLEFNLPEEREEFQLALKGSSMSIALSEIANEIFRPARKHGFPDKELNDLVEKNPDAVEIIGMLETKFYEILEENDITI